jgi:hypothetical protein
LKNITNRIWPCAPFWWWEIPTWNPPWLKLIPMKKPLRQSSGYYPEQDP